MFSCLFRIVLLEKIDGVRNVCETCCRAADLRAETPTTEEGAAVCPLGLATAVERAVVSVVIVGSLAVLFIYLLSGTSGDSVADLLQGRVQNRSPGSGDPVRERCR